MKSLQYKLYLKVRTVFAKYSPLSFQRIIEKIEERRLEKQYYKNTNLHCNEVNRNEVICMIDGKVKHGGLTDRVNGIITCYNAAVKANRDFKICFIKPFNLYDYLIPNKYNWFIDPNEVSFNQSSKPVFIRAYTTAIVVQRGEQLIKEIQKSPNKQIHVYTNLNTVEHGKYYDIFKILFKPSERLSKIINIERERIGPNYISATFRFQQLLNDFKEGEFNSLSEKEGQELLSKCLKVIEQLHENYPTKRILVTSDSDKFIKASSDFPFVISSSGKTIHMEYNDSSNYMTQAKAFVDLFLLSEAEKIFSIVIPPMYDSGFPKLASKINNRPFEILRISD